MEIITSKQIIFEKAKLLNPLDRAQLIDALFESLAKPNPEIEKLWIKEADSRHEAYKRGELKATDWEEIRKRYE